MVYYFGKPWAGLDDGDSEQVLTPIGERCTVCSELIVEGDRGRLCVTVSAQGWGGSAYVHVECEALGIVGHQYGVCSCTGHDTASRASALLLWKRLVKLGELP